MSEKVGSIYYDLDLDDKKFKTGMTSASKNITGLSKGFKDAEKGSKILLASIVALAAGAVAFGIKSVKAFQESQDILAQTNAVIKSTGGAAGVSAVQVQLLGSKFQYLTKFSDETVRTGENLLLTFTKIGKDIFPRATEVMLDMSQALGQDVKNSAIQLGKALQDPILGVTALRRVGVNFSDSQKVMIQRLVATGKSAEAQRLILKELETEFGGSAKAAGQTFGGQLAKLKNNLGDLEEEVGEVILKSLAPLIGKINDWYASSEGLYGILEKINPIIQENKDKIYILAGAITAALIPALISLATSLWAVVAPLSPFLVVGGLIGYLIYQLIQRFGSLQGIINAAKAKFIELWTWLSTTFSPFILTIVEMFKKDFLPSLQAIWSDIQTSLIPAFQDLWHVLKDDLWPALQNLLKLLGPDMVKGLVIFAGIIIGVVVAALAVLVVSLYVVIRVVTLLVATFSFMLNRATASINILRDRFSLAFDNIKKGLSSVGDYFEGLWKRISQGADKIKKVLDKINPFHKESPSLVEWVSKGTQQIGGLYKGMFDNLSDMSSESKVGLTNAVKSSVGLNNRSGNAPIANSNQVVNIDVSGIVARSRSDLREIGMDLIGAVNENLRARNLKELGTTNL